MATVRYRISHDLESLLLDKPFVAAVPADMCWSSGGGGAWFIGRQQIFDVPGPKAILTNKREGTLQMCIPPMGSQGEIFEFRIFSSQDGNKIGRQVGAAVYFELSAPAPRQLHVSTAGLKPTSLKLMWEPPPSIGNDEGSSDLGGYVIHAHPLGGSFVERLGSDEERNVENTLGWNHIDQKLMHFCGHEIEDLVPGMSYRFQINALHKRGLETLEGSSSNGVTVTMPMHLPPSAPGAPEPAGENAVKRGEAHLQWTVPQDDGFAGITSYVLYWDQKPIDEGDGVIDGPLPMDTSNTHFVRGGIEFYPFPGHVYSCSNKNESRQVDCKFRLPPDCGTHGRFCCAAFNAAGEGPVGPPSERLELVDKHGRELFDALDADGGGAIDLLNKALVHYGGLDDLLSAMGSAGLLPASDQGDEEKRQLGMKQALAMKVEEAGGVESVLKAMNGLDMENFSESMAILKLMQQQNGSAQEWAELCDLVAKAGGVGTVASALRDCEIADIVSAKEGGLFKANSQPGSTSKILKMFASVGGVEKFCNDVQDNKIGTAAIQDNMKAIALMSKAGGSPEEWCRVMEGIIAAGGPASVGALLEYLQGKGNALLAAAAGVDPEVLVEAVELLKAGGLLESREALELLRRLVQIPGGPQQLLKALDLIHPQCLAGGIKVLHAAGLHSPTCLDAELGGLSEMDCWLKLATRTSKDWGGIRPVLALLEGGGEGLGKPGMRKMTQETEEFLEVVDRCGGTHVVQNFITDVTVRGGIKQFMQNLGDFSLSQVINALQVLKRYGYDSADGLDRLNTILQMVAAAGGAEKFLKALEHVDMQNFAELIDFAKGASHLTSNEILDSHVGGKTLDKMMEKCLSVLERVLSECALEHFLEMLKEVNIEQLLALVPHLLNAGFLSRKDRYGHVSPASSSAEALLRWIVSAGGVDQVIFAVARINGRNFAKCMEIIRAAGLSELDAKEGKKQMDEFIAWLRGVKGEGGLERLIACSSGLNLVSLVGLVQTLAGNSRLTSRISDTKSQAEYDEIAHNGQCRIGELSDFIITAGGLDHFMQQLSRLNPANLDRIVNLVEKAGLGHFEGHASHHFQPWMDLLTLVYQEGGPTAIMTKCLDLDLENFGQCIALLRTAGILQHRWHSAVPKPKTEEDESLALRIEQWCQVVKLIKGNGGPVHFLKNFEGVDIEDLLTSVGLLRDAGLVRPSEGPPVPDSNEVSHQKGESKRMKNDQLREFTQKVKASGGFDTFWWGLKRVELSELAQDLHCCDVMKRKLCEHARDEDYAWELLRNPQRFDDLFSQLTDAQRGSKEELSYKERALIAQRLRAVGGADGFLKLYHGLDLQAASEHERILKSNHVPSTDILSKLVGLWPLLKKDAVHLDGALGVVFTLVRWIEKYSDKDPARMWSWLNQQIAWLLTAIGENNVMLQSMNLAQSSGDQTELTPAKLAQFLQTLRPIGGVHGFLQAFKGLDIATASTQSRVLYDVNIRDLKTTRLLTSIFQLLGSNVKQLKGLEHFVKHFGKDFMTRAQDMLGDVERWHLLTDGLVQGARNHGMVSPEGLDLPATPSGTQRVLDLLKLAWGLEEAAGPDVGPLDWKALQHELRMCHLQGVLARLRSDVRPKMIATWTLPKSTEPVTQSCGTCGALLQANYRIARGRALSAQKARSTSDLSVYGSKGSLGCRPVSATYGSRPAGNHNSPVRLAPMM
eukprot:gnl/MRDRNA2_/MRDRNA2_82739_c0_seq2.p1 gnl/MRDRNA2_/MRDRNA2_82739_c0~~gnl/MRDRNA2_/MRDRNA2_82739_c0_seq2.p1  ORF type:complete len:1788 (+),score=334.61 gnl/MRDRNA2_/MRDRNA2_82739_c0_seq2:276-5366(+)